MRRLDGVLELVALRHPHRPAKAGEPMPTAAGQPERREISKPLHSDWAWRPELWSVPVSPGGVRGMAGGTALGREVRVFHDCPRRECAVSQVTCSGAQGRAVQGVFIEVDHFEGRFLSLAIDLPAAALEGLSRRHILRLTADCETERPLSVYARLNVRHGPNVAQALRALGRDDHADLDLAALELDEERVTAAWVDLIFEAPAMNRIVLGDMTLSRRPRLEF